MKNVKSGKLFPNQEKRENERALSEVIGRVSELSRLPKKTFTLETMLWKIMLWGTMPRKCSPFK